MADACREVISTWWALDKPGDNASLLHDRYLRVAVKDKRNHPDARKDLFDAMCQSLVQSEEIYSAAYERHISSFNNISKGLFRTTGRLVIGLGVENVLETGLTLNHTFGTPMIPGTALKGLAAHYCDQAWGAVDSRFKLGGEYHRTIFGTTEDSGHFIFYDAWITPESLEGSLQHDVMTPHHGEYYSDEKGKMPPTDFDDPNPVTFLSIVGTFHVAVSCDVPGPAGSEWSNQVFDLLSDALQEWGIGGKTNAGYGRLIKSTGESKTGKDTKAAPREQVVAESVAPRVRRPTHRKGDVISVTREADPNVKRGKPYFRADDGFGGFIQFGSVPTLEIGQKIRLEISGVMNEGYVFVVPGSREDQTRNKTKRGRL